MYKKIGTLITFLLLIFSTSNGQDKSWNIEDCINYAMENNITIKQTVLNTEYSENVLNQSKLSRLPSLNANGNYNFSFGRE